MAPVLPSKNLVFARFRARMSASAHEDRMDGRNLEPGYGVREGLAGV
jgi:hypothetical protein